MVAQIGLVSSDIRAHIEKIEAFSLLRLDDDGALAALAATKRDSYVRFLVARPSTIVVEEVATIAASAAPPQPAANTLTVTTANNVINEHHNSMTTDAAINQPRKSDVGLNVTFAEDTSLPIREYFHLIDQQRNEKVHKIKELFESIGPILIKLEALILGTFTGESAKMKLCYADWEKELFKLLIR